MLEYYPDKKELIDFKELFKGDEETHSDLNSIIGIVRSPKPEVYNRH